MLHSRRNPPELFSVMAPGLEADLLDRIFQVFANHIVSLRKKRQKEIHRRPGLTPRSQNLVPQRQILPCLLKLAKLSSLAVNHLRRPATVGLRPKRRPWKGQAMHPARAKIERLESGRRAAR